jgi:predicted ATP-binding protein involved in virulence
MRIKKLELKNFKCFEELTIEFPENKSGLAVFVGVNGAGKTALLEGIARGLKAVRDGLQPDSHDSFDMQLEDDQIRVVPHQLGSKNSFEKQSGYGVSTTIEISNKDIGWHFRQGGGNSESVVELTRKLRWNVKRGGDDELPVLLFYNTNRFWSHQELKEVDLFPVGSRLDTYVDCLHPNVSSKVIYEWFKRMEFIRFQKRANDLSPELESVRGAIMMALHELSKEDKVEIGAYFSGESDELLVNTGDGRWFPFRMLSEGHRSTLGLFADIAFRLAELNPHVRRESKGIVLIDEIELHLHPAWQRKVVEALHRTFPNIQFILTTHSPQVLSNVPTENVFVLKDFKLRIFPPYHTYGKDSNAILNEVFEIGESRPEHGVLDLKELYSYIDKNDRKNAEKKLEELRGKFGASDTDLVRAEMYIELLDE